MRFSKTSIIKIFIYSGVIFLLISSLVVVWNRYYTFHFGWDKVENRYTLTDSTGQNDLIVEMEIIHSHSYTYHIHARIYSMPDANGEIYRITRLNFNATRNDRYAARVNQDYNIPAESYYNLFLIDSVHKHDIFTIRGSIELEKTTPSDTFSEQLDFTISYTFPYSLEELIYLDYACMWLEIAILVVMGILFFKIIKEIKSVVKEAKMPQDELEERKRYAHYYRSRSRENGE